MHRRRGFSLLELVAAMTILVTVIAILGRIITDTQRAWRRGNDAAELDINARSAFGLIEAELSAAIANSNLVFELDKNADIELHGTNIAQSLIFYRVTSPPPKQDAEMRSLYQMHIFATPKNDDGYSSIYRERRLVPIDEDYPGDWEHWAETNRASQAILENIVELRIKATSPHKDDSELEEQPVTLESHDSYDSRDFNHLLPVMLDIEVLLLPRRMAIRLQDESESEKKKYATWFTHRIWLSNREGGHLP